MPPFLPYFPFKASDDASRILPIDSLSSIPTMTGVQKDKSENYMKENDTLRFTAGTPLQLSQNDCVLIITIQLKHSNKRLRFVLPQIPKFSQTDTSSLLQPVFVEKPWSSLLLSQQLLVA